MPTDETKSDVLRLVSSMPLAEQRELLNSMLDRSATNGFDDLFRPQRPTLLRTPRKVRGFQIRIDLLGVKPPIWRRLILPGNLTLDLVHAVLNEAMGWTDSHLHRFRTGNDPNSPVFLTQFDVEEGDEGVLEDDVRLDHVVAEAGDRLLYDYDFGDGWEHLVKVEAVLPEPPDEVELVTGRRACPPEDVGGVWGYEGVAQWIDSGYDKALLPENFDNAKHARDWLPLGWHPAAFDLEAARHAVRDALERVDDA